MHTQKTSSQYRDNRVRWTLFGAASLMVLVLLIALAAFLSLVPRSWREGPRTVGSTCTQSFGGSPESSGGAAIEVATGLTKTCGYAYAVRPGGGGGGTHYLLTLAETEVDAGSRVRVTLTSHDTWRRQDWVSCSIQGPAKLRSTQLAVDVSPRTTRVEVVTSMHGGGRYAMRGVTLRPSTVTGASSADWPCARYSQDYK